MRILLICPSYPPFPCGVGDYTAHMADRFRAAGDETHVLTSQPAREDSFVHAVMPADWTVLNVKQVVETIKDIQPDLTHIIYPASGYRHGTIALLPKLIRSQLPTMPVCVSLDELTRMRPRIRLELFLAGLGAHSVIIGTHYDCQQYYRWQQQYARLSANRIKPTVIPTGTNILVRPSLNLDRQAVRAKLNIGANEILLIYFGYVRPDKGIDILLDAFEKVSARNAKVHLALYCDFDRRARDDAGVYRYRKAMFERMRAIQRRNPNLHHPGYLERPDDISAALLAADLGVLPFRSGASEHSSTLQAMLIHGLPLVSTKGWLTTQEIGELIIPANDNTADGVAQAIEQVMLDPNRLEMVRQRARAWAHAHDWPMITQQYLELYRRLLSVCHAHHAG